MGGWNRVPAGQRLLWVSAIPCREQVPAWFPVSYWGGRNLPMTRAGCVFPPFPPLFPTLCEEQVPSRICRGSDLEGNL